MNNNYDPKIHHRRSIRLRGYDYSHKGLYFITICTQHHASLFGDIVKDEMQLNDAGEMLKSEWLELSKRFSNIQLHESVIMPNHIHCLLEIVGAPLVGAQNSKQSNGVKKTIGEMIGAYKSLTTCKYIHHVKNNNWQKFNKKLWQRNFWEHIIRDENEHQKITEYIQTNPAKWAIDTLNYASTNQVMETAAIYADDDNNYVIE